MKAERDRPTLRPNSNIEWTVALNFCSMSAFHSFAPGTSSNLLPSWSSVNIERNNWLWSIFSTKASWENKEIKLIDQSFKLCAIDFEYLLLLFLFLSHELCLRLRWVVEFEFRIFSLLLLAEHRTKKSNRFKNKWKFQLTGASSINL